MRELFRRYFFTACLLIGSLANYQLNPAQLKELLTPAEWISMLGNLNSVGNYTITYPKYTPAATVERVGENSTKSPLGHQLHIKAPELGRNFSLELVSTPNLLSNNFVFLETFANGSNPLVFHDEDRDCYFRSRQAAVSLCHGVRGIVHSDDENYFVIHPLPKRFHNETSNPHLLIRKSHTVASPSSCPHSHLKKSNLNEALLKNLEYNVTSQQTKDFREAKDSSGKSSILRRRKRETFPEGAPAFVETAVFVDRDLFDHMKSNFPVDTERELIRFVLAMINAVQLLYHDPSLGRPVNFVLKRLEILKEEAAGLLRPPDIDRFLSNFCNWQRTKNPVGDREPLHWDHALILTGLDLYVRGKHGKISSQVVGLAPVSGMCTASSSCTVNEGRHFESVYVVAHEIGHNLGMRHDGPSAENECDPSSYIMSPTLGSGKITWSVCSKRYLQKFLDTPQSRCLLDHGSSAGQLDHSAEGALPGERFDASQQCMLKYGRGSKHSSQQPLDDVCRDLHCERERYTWTSHPALEGTMCGNGMWCRGGRCVTRGLVMTAAYTSAQQTLSRIEKINGGWSKWRSFSDCASGCLFGEEGRLRSGSTGIMVSERTCNNPCPQGSGAECEGPSTKHTTCTAQQCSNVPRLTIREFAEQICGRARDVDKDLTGSGMQKISSDPEEACLVWCQKRNGGTKSRGWTFPDGTACQTRRNRYGRASYCIKGKCEEFTCDSFDETAFSLSPDLCPIDKDDNEITWRTNLRRREAVRWKSASGCHYNCISPGSGIRLVTLKGKFGKSSIQLCQPDKYGCGRVKSPFQHASMVCAKYKEKVRRLSGLGMQISPAVEDPDRPCRVACQDDSISHRFYLVNGEEGWFPFGTDCSRGNSDKKAYCVSGKCLEFGSDDTPLSESEFTLPLLSRSRRSLENNNATKITAKLDEKQLEEIISELNKTLLGSSNQASGTHQFNIDLSNPIHVNMDADEEHYPQNYFRKNDYDYANYA
ncbi:A disintegrin and metalloproteinase with thrombospondin motifs adt-1-like [Anoplophora glabripennis]|uniref:A disintegrin and metalloproteinase with thrombospondin motifs adt-1-like n=1 Tax=Anoplophora glabripennis TaxID=217634 RepID=UPI0008756D04|nr:A disintegrin and metalloproteinase with thrombospondin motifs adt-1-like [Anoplophora glabripennis]